MRTKKPMKMYVLVRNDLDPSYKMVQGGHSLAEYSQRGDVGLYNEWDNETLIYLGVPNEFSLERWIEKLERTKKPFVFFREPVLHNQLTSIACIDSGEIFKNLRLA